MITLEINGQTHEVDVDPDTPLLWVLRDPSALPAPSSAAAARCAAPARCYVDGQPTRSCVLPIEAVAGAAITTIEGIEGKEADAVQTAWQTLDVPQCGYCQSGQIMTAVALLVGDPEAERRRYRRRAHRQHLPLRHLSPHPRRRA